MVPFRVSRVVAASGMKPMLANLEFNWSRHVLEVLDIWDLLLGSSYEGSYHVGSILGAPDF